MVPKNRPMVPGPWQLAWEDCSAQRKKRPGPKSPERLLVFSCVVWNFVGASLTRRTLSALT